MNRFFLSLPVVSLLLAGIAGAQPSGTALRIPVLGYLGSDSPVALRPIAGSPGAVLLGSSLPLPAAITRAFPFPGGQFAIVERAGATESGVMTLNLSGTGDIIPISNTFPHSDRIAFSPSGSVAVVYSAAANQAQVVTGLPAAAQLSRTVDLSPAGLPLVSIAVSDDSQAILAGVSNGSRGAIWIFTAGQTARWVTDAGVPSALRFFSSTQDAVAADKGWRQISLLPAGGIPRTLAGAVQGIHEPRDLEISTDQQSVWIVDANAVDPNPSAHPRTIQPGAPAASTPVKLLHINLSSGAIATVDSSITAGTLTRLAGDSVFLLTSADGLSSGIWWPAGASTSVWKLTGPSGQ